MKKTLILTALVSAVLMTASCGTTAPASSAAAPASSAPASSAAAPASSAPASSEAAPASATATAGELPKTYDNLLAAVEGETYAKSKYISFAAAAKAEGNAVVATLYSAAADAENIHINREYEISNGMKAWAQPAIEDVEAKTSAENLQSCIDGETYEATEMYPEFLKVATDEDQKDAMEIFRYARDAEASHAELFKVILDNLDKYASGAETVEFYMCPTCGLLEMGAAPDVCPICGVTADKFVAYSSGDVAAAAAAPASSAASSTPAC